MQYGEMHDSPENTDSCESLYVLNVPCTSVQYTELHNLYFIIIIIMVIFKCYFSGELIALS